MLPEVLSAEPMSTARKIPVATRAGIQAMPLTWSLPPTGAAEAMPRARPSVTAATPAQTGRGTPTRITNPATSSVAGSSITKMGWTTAMGPVASATAWQTAATITRPMPASHTFCRSRCPISDRCIASLSGTFWAARRCITEAVPLLRAVRTANRTLITAPS